MKCACVLVAAALSRAVLGDVVCPVDFGSEVGAVRAINGLNHGPQTSGRVVKRNIEEFRDLHIPSVRLHDATLFSPGMHLVDVPAIFPIWNPDADANDPKNYFFDATDDYLKILREECGVTQIVYRLGVSIEHTKPRRYFAKCPADFEKFAEVCAGIVRHYTKSAWANGFDAGVTHWEIWNEPNNVPEMWDKDYETFLKMYVTVAGRLRREFPDIKIGGPANAIAKPENRLELLIDACKKHGVPLDFYSEHGYSGMPEEHAKRMRAMRTILDKAGFEKTEIHFNEWHYFPCSWKALWYPDTAMKAIESPDGINGIVAAAHVVHALTVWQDAPVDMANFYATVLAGWGLYDVYGNKRPTYYAFKLFGDFLAASPVRVKASSSDSRVTVLAGRNATTGKRQVLVSAMKLAAGEKIQLELPGCSGPVKIVALEGSDGFSERTVDVRDGRMEIVATNGSGVWLVKLTDEVISKPPHHRTAAALSGSPLQAIRANAAAESSGSTGFEITSDGKRTQPMRLVWSGRAVFDRELSFPKGVSFLPHGHYAAEVTSLPAALDILDGEGKTVMSAVASTNVAPPYVFHLALSCGHPASLFVTKDGETHVVGTPLPPSNVDLRAASNRTSFRVVPRGGAGAVTATMSAGVGQADVRFVTRGPSGMPYCEDGRLYFTFSARYFGAHLGIGSIEVAHPERGWRFEGTVLFDYGDGKLRNDLAAHLWLDEQENVWKAYVCNFSTSSAIDGLGGRAKGGVNVAVSRDCPLRGFHILTAKSLDLDGMYEDPSAYYDAAAKKWRIFISNLMPEGTIKACLLESDRWDGGFRPMTDIVPEDSTGTTIALMDGRPRCLTGSADRAYYIYEYPTLKKLGEIPLDVTPWGERKGWPHGRGWPAYAEVKMSDGSTRKVFLTMDRVNFPGMPKPNWTYGKLFIYIDTDKRKE